MVWWYCFLVLSFGIFNSFQNSRWQLSQENYQRPRNPLTNFGRIHSKSWGWSLSLGNSDLVWIEVNPERQGGGKLLKDSDGVWRHSNIVLVLWSRCWFWWDHDLVRVEVVWPMDSLFFIGLSMRSHIHAWNMARGWLHERNIWSIHAYVEGVRGSPKPSWLFPMFNKS